MKSVPQHLLSEDRQEYERVLDEALRSAPNRPELAAVGQRLNPEQLRTMALNATALITAAAATEYQHYVKVREELRVLAPSTAWSTRHPGLRDTVAVELPVAEGVDAVQPDSRLIGGVSAQRWAKMSYPRRLLAAVLGLRVRPEAHARILVPAALDGSGGFSFFAAPVAVLAGAATCIFFLASLILKSFNAGSESAQSMITAGWVSGAVLAGALAALLAFALRNRPSLEAGPHGELSKELARAKEAWREALLERGILPFLREALADPGASLAQDAAVSATLMQNISPVLASLQPTKNAVIRIGAVLIVKVNWTVSVFQLTAAQQATLDHQPQLATSPQDVLSTLGLAPAQASAPETAREPRSASQANATPDVS
ncbi:hypothetical protein [Streptomyces sp. NPDC001401]|uniref:hypothetical protein n=1 Tax=Streptomyces sp. NPDC001401 TaxID=3364570 RepID=UPI003678E03D